MNSLPNQAAEQEISQLADKVNDLIALCDRLRLENEALREQRGTLAEERALLLEKNELTAGSTWHAAGNVPNFAGSWAVMNMQRYSAAMYRTLGDDVDYPMNYHVTGAIRLAHSKERMQEFE